MAAFTLKDVLDFGQQVVLALFSDRGPSIVKQLAQVLQTDEAIKLADKMLEMDADAKDRAVLK